MIKTVVVFCLALFSINFASASDVDSRDSFYTLDKVKIESFGYDSGGATSGYIRLKLSGVPAGMYSYYHLKKSNDALLYIFTVYTQKKSLHVEYDYNNYSNANAYRPITAINTID
ncbi:hypothetical protein [Proteus myxofaciens]|uniref:Secreted protein n=1 Tax=Proteus myxofaciens ATCC 19692 TaxID=1354337 RepID=A0A198FCI2_9GAMM|nr:hypothetical protein [Proteus myxofaciens]OAT22577.1 hypothetical protein M983_2990 [Proteus myxofaciens ATCC 19692]